VKFLANENFPLTSIKLLRNHGYEVRSVDEELPGGKDREVLEIAQLGNLVILTFDRDYGELLYRNKALPPEGIVYFRFNPATPDEPAAILLNLLQKGTVSLFHKYTVVERNRIRQRTFKG
jgi:predicted nuclease of predicted toxin-antitoxin system